MKNNELPPDILTAMQEATRFAMTGIGDPEILRRIQEEANQIREEIYQKYGLLDIAVPAIRELRDEE